MPEAGWTREQEIFHGAADLAEPEREDFLRQQCGPDDTLLTELRLMLRTASQNGPDPDVNLSNLARVLESGENEYPPDQSFANHVFGCYVLTRLLGEGGMGKVYLARRTDVGSWVAVKFLREAWISSARRERFALEQRIVAQLRHPHIASLYDVGVTQDGTPYFVMEYVDGVPLTQYCSDHRCTLPERLNLFLKMCEAVRYLHSQAIVHPDIKPSNTLVTMDGDVKLLDFGIAKHLELTEEGTLLSRTGFRLMTAAYASPEQWLGNRPGLHADVYSLGVVLYELLTGSLPFDMAKATAAEAERLVTQQEPAAPSTAVRKNSAGAGALVVKRSEWADLDVVCRKALQKEPERRYQTVDSLMQDIRAFLAGEPLSARPGEWGYRASKLIRRNRKAVVALAAVLTLISGLSGFFVWRLNQERQAALSEAAHANQLLHFTLNLFRGGTQDAGPPSDLRVSEVLERGAKEARTLQGDPLRQAEMFATLGSVFQSMGDLPKAEEDMHSAWMLRRKSLGDAALLTAESEIGLAFVHSDQGRLDMAEKEVHAGLSVLENAKSPEDPEVLNGKVTLAQILITRGSNNAAIQLLLQVVRMQPLAGSSDADRAAAFFNLGSAYFVAGDYEHAMQYTNSYLVLQRSLYGAIHPSIADGEQYLCMVERERNELAEAEKHCRTAFSIALLWYGPDSITPGSAMRALGTVLTRENKTEEAKPLLERALFLAEKHGKVHEGIGTALASVGLNDYQSHHYVEAEQHFDRSLEVFREIYGSDHNFNIAMVLWNLAEIASKQSDMSRAEALAREALAIFLEVQGPEGVKTAMAHVQLGNFLACEKKYAEAKQESKLGYDILVKRSGPKGEFFEMAKNDLAQEAASLR